MVVWLCLGCEESDLVVNFVYGLWEKTLGDVVQVGYSVRRIEAKVRSGFQWFRFKYGGGKGNLRLKVRWLVTIRDVGYVDQLVVSKLESLDLRVVEASVREVTDESSVVTWVSRRLRF